MSVTEERLIELLNSQREQIVASVNKQIESMSTEIKELKELATDVITLAKENQNEIDDLRNIIKELSETVDDQANRSMRKTLIFKGFPWDKNERSWDDTKDKLINTVIEKANVHPDHACKMF